MAVEIECCLNTIASTAAQAEEEEELLAQFTIERARLVLGYHRSLPGYTPTPLCELSHLAAKIGLDKIWVKDESKRFNLNAFKVLGISYGIARYLAGAGAAEPLQFPSLTDKVGPDTLLVTATDGNHGYGVAFMAKLFGCKARVLMPVGTVPARAERIRALGASCDVLEVNYDACVLRARQEAEERGGLLIQDTALDTDTEEELQTPLAIMQGYCTMLTEYKEQQPGPAPTHVFLQAGVASFSGALAAHLQHLYPAPRTPSIVIVEPNGAPCLFRSGEARDGAARAVTGEMETIMAGLNCGVPSVQGWPILRRTAAAFLSCEDEVTARGMRVLLSPLPGDPAVTSGESGAVGLGALYTLLTRPNLAATAAELGLTPTSRVLCISTEGDTDPEGFFDSIWA